MVLGDERDDNMTPELLALVESIASSLLSLTILLRDARVRQEATLASVAQWLVDEAHRADEAFARADDRLVKAAKYPTERKAMEGLAHQLERDAIRAWERLREFQAWHPEVTVPDLASWEQPKNGGPACAGS